MMNIVLKEYKREKNDNTYKALDDGIYNAIINDVKLQTSKKGNKMMVLELELQGEKMFKGAHLGGRRENYYIMLNDKYAGVKLHSLLQGVGIDVKIGDEINVEQLVVSNVMCNKNIRVMLEKSSYTNKDGIEKECNRVKYLLQGDKKQENNDILNDDDIPF